MDRIVYFVVGDAGLNAGNGTFLRSLRMLPSRLRRLRISNEWTLVISIHGSENRVADLAHVPGNGEGAYTAEELESLFSGDQFQNWRDRYGPSRIVLNACQVSANYESTIINLLTKSGSGQAVQGLGDGCRPGTETMILQENGSDIVRRTQFTTLSEHRRRTHLESLVSLNREWGYFGAPPVPANQVLHYYFDEEPRGGWPVVRVTHNRKNTNVPFFDRSSHSRFLRLCDQGIGTLERRQSTVPTVRSRR